MPRGERKKAGASNKFQNLEKSVISMVMAKERTGGRGGGWEDGQKGAGRGEGGGGEGRAPRQPRRRTRHMEAERLVFGQPSRSESRRCEPQFGQGPRERSL